MTQDKALVGVNRISTRRTTMPGDDAFDSWARENVAPNVPDPKRANAPKISNVPASGGEDARPLHEPIAMPAPTSGPVLTITFSQMEVATLLMACASARKSALQTPLPDDPTAKAETQENVTECVSQLDIMMNKLQTAKSWS